MSVSRLKACSVFAGSPGGGGWIGGVGDLGQERRNVLSIQVLVC